MEEIKIKVHNWKRKDNATIIKAVRKALQEIENDGFYSGKNHYNDYNNTGIELDITIK